MAKNIGKIAIYMICLLDKSLYCSKFHKKTGGVYVETKSRKGIVAFSC